MEVQVHTEIKVHTEVKVKEDTEVKVKEDTEVKEEDTEEALKDTTLVCELTLITFPKVWLEFRILKFDSLPISFSNASSFLYLYYVTFSHQSINHLLEPEDVQISLNK